MSITACVEALEAAAVVNDLTSLIVVAGFRKDEEVVVILGAMNGFGAAYFERSLVTLVWLGCFAWIDRVDDDEGLFEISNPASCWVTDRTEAMPVKAGGEWTTQEARKWSRCKARVDLVHFLT